MMKKMPFNIYSIKDIDEWRKNFFYPVSMKVGETIEVELCRILIDEYRHFKNDLKVHYRIASKHLCLETFNVLMKLVMAHEMREYDGVEFILTNHRLPDDVELPARCNTFELYKEGEDIQFSWLDLAYLDDYHYNVPLWKKVGRRAKSVLRLREIPRMCRTRAAVMNPNDCTRKYVMDHYGNIPYVLYPMEIFKTRWRGRTDHEPEISAFATRLASAVDSIFGEITGSSVPRKILQKYEKVVCDYFSRIEFDLNQARRFCTKLPHGVNFYTGTAKYFTRIVSEAVRERGGQVTGFPHGGGLSRLVWPALSFVEFATTDRFACLDQGEADSYRKYPTINDVEFPVIKGLGESILNIDRSRFKTNSWVNLSKVSTIMYVSTGFFYDRFDYGVPSDTQRLDLHLKIIDFLLALNKKIILKNRPKTAYLSKEYSHFGYFGDRVEYMITPFTQVLDKADLFILEGIGSSALYEAMTLTRTPIILFRLGFPKCTPGFDDLLRKRCYVVDLYEDDRNRLCFDELHLRKIFGLV